ncbi:MAG: TldD/PmbA family protein, partial [Proteobacteria bacterium]|nr:TldD/PmbA family protein [Pseudomonadota bacterium]
MTADKPTPVEPLELLSDLVRRARGAGADAADAVMFESASLAVAQRLGKSEGVERAESRDVGLRVFRGRRQAVVSTTDTSAGALAEIVERALAMARAVPEDPYCGLPAAELLAREVAELDLCDEDEPAPRADCARCHKDLESAEADAVPRTLPISPPNIKFAHADHTEAGV